MAESIYNRLAKEWAAKHPDLDKRLQRAIALVPNVHPSSANRDMFVVEGSGGNCYTVRVNRKLRISACTCEDFIRRQERCKHILACALYEKAHGIEE
jgi:hypothetical protein